MKSNGNRVIAALSIAVSVALVLSALAFAFVATRDAAPAAAQANSGSQITVVGTGRINAKPDTLKLTVGVSIQESTVKAAQAKVDEVIAAMVARIKAAGVAENDYRTAQYGVEPVMEYPGEKGGAGAPKLLGYRVTNMLEITLRDTERAADLLDQLTTAGANTIYGISYSFADPDALARQAYEGAIKDAEAKATRLAGLANVTLGKVVKVTEAAANVPGPVYQGDRGAAGGAGPYPGQQTVQVDLVVTYEAAAK